MARLELPFERVAVPPGAKDVRRLDVVRGDNLWNIARAHYGEGCRHTMIFDANKDQIRDPDLIYPGQVFSLPTRSIETTVRESACWRISSCPSSTMAGASSPIFAAVTFLAALTGAAWLFWPLFVLTLWSVYFFRDPPRGVPQDDGVLIAPADGLVQMVVDAVPPAELGLGDAALTRVSIFLSVFDVHINRAPCAGTIDVVAYRPGKFLNAAADKASEDNERMAIALSRADGGPVGFVQIAGWVARRIVCYVKPGQAVLAGERFGHIRFGSRTDLYLPAGARLLVAPGQRMIGGETVIAELDPAVGQPRRAVDS